MMKTIKSEGEDCRALGDRSKHRPLEGAQRPSVCPFPVFRNMRRV